MMYVFDVKLSMKAKNLLFRTLGGIWVSYSRIMRHTSISQANGVLCTLLLLLQENNNDYSDTSIPSNCACVLHTDSLNCFTMLET